MVLSPEENLALSGTLENYEIVPGEEGTSPCAIRQADALTFASQAIEAPEWDTRCPIALMP